MKLNPNHVITIEGKEYVLFAGLLDAAHQLGIKSVETSLSKAPTPDDNEAIIHATVTLESGAVFQAYGDASPANCGSRTANALIRMAETRGVARAFRFATNIAMTAAEELGGNVPIPPKTPSPPPIPRTEAIQKKVVGDEDDLPFNERGEMPEGKHQPHDPTSVNPPRNIEGSDSRYPLERDWKSKYENGRCVFCGTNHIEQGQRIVAVKDPDGKTKFNDRTGKEEPLLIWGDVGCYLKWLDEPA